MSESPHPLDGLRVLDMSRVLAGPWVGQMLADLGADVVKLEAPGGDDTRGWGPPFVQGEGGERLDAAYFHAANRGKRSVTADFRTEEGRALVRDLAARADVVVENFRAGSLERQGLGWDDLSAANPRLVWCTITGFGLDGPDAARPGYDYVIQGMSGIMDLTGEPDGPPTRIGVAFADLFTGLYAANAIQAALLMRERTGRGQRIDMALLDTMVAVLANQAQSCLVTGESPRRTGNAHPAISPYQIIPCADFPAIVTVGNDAQFERFCGALGLAGVAQDARFATNRDRVANRDALDAIIEARSAEIPRAELLEALDAANVPCGPINTVAQAFEEPQVRHREMVVDLPHTGEGPHPYVRTPIRFSEAELRLERGAPRLDEHGEALRQHGWGD